MKQNIGIIIIIVIMLSLIGLAFYGNSTAYMHPIAIIEMENGNKIVVELYDDQAPITVKNFIKLAEEGFYNGLTFHRTIPDFMVQGGDPAGDGTGGSSQTITGEFIFNGVENYVSHKAGTISMARSSNYNSASSQFFITVADSTNLDGDYAAFGRVIEGMDEVYSIANSEVITRDEGAEGQDKPKNPPKIKTITIKKHAVKYDKNTEYDKAEMQNLESLVEYLKQLGCIINGDGTFTAPDGSKHLLNSAMFSANEEETTTSPEEVDGSSEIENSPNEEVVE